MKEKIKEIVHANNLELINFDYYPRDISRFNGIKYDDIFDLGHESLELVFDISSKSKEETMSFKTLSRVFDKNGDGITQRTYESLACYNKGAFELFRQAYPRFQNVFYLLKNNLVPWNKDHPNYNLYDTKLKERGL
ncbi:MAG: hypothetical protein ACP5OG_03840 [Candidatus Nanoarchaeia archaeon]